MREHLDIWRELVCKARALLGPDAGGRVVEEVHGRAFRRQQPLFDNAAGQAFDETGQKTF